ncbi:epimerase [Tamlana sp. 2201CG12-4]|uniref:epimerase n=1 Tax=Tamlana sp. 2201CG12-4 TaxID=3112582 RepID=UPI002DB64438|nr:epimerase [Tamlana sp. 2201CG12-4]MEC3908132.1 epimerase [Tamlana sp. 2201CG12-4]
MLECLDHNGIQEVLVINRRSIELQHPKLKEVLLSDFSNLEAIKEQLTGYDACFYCMGVSALGLNEKKYTDITFEITRVFADILYGLNPHMTFNYVSGAGTDSSEQGTTMWARVKGKTENYVLNKGFKTAYAFRPGFIIPERGIKSGTAWYNAVYTLIRPLFPLFKRSNTVTTTTKIGLAMINSLFKISDITYLENKDINHMSQL